MSASTHIKLQSSDYKIFDVELAVAKKSVTIKTMLEDLGTNESDDGEPVPLPNVEANVLEKIIEWCTYHKNDAVPVEDDNVEKRTDDISEWDKKYMDVDQKVLFSIILAANYLDIKGLLDVACKTVANMIKGKTPQEIRVAFNLEQLVDKDAADGGAEEKTGEKNTEAAAAAASASSNGAAKAQKIEPPSATA